MSRLSGKKRASGSLVSQSDKRAKLVKANKINNFRKSLEVCGLTIRDPPEECILEEELILFSKKLKSHFKNDQNYPMNVTDFLNDFESEFTIKEYFKHYIYPKIFKKTNDELIPISDSLMKILLNQQDLQCKLLDILFEKALDLAIQGCVIETQAIMKCLIGMEDFNNQVKLASQLINLLQVSDDKQVKIEVLLSIPDITQSEVHDTMATEISKLFNENHDLMHVLLSCVSFLDVSDGIYYDLQKRALGILRSSPSFTFFPNIIKFLLVPGRMDENSAIDIIQELRNSLNWSNIRNHKEDIPNNQVLTAIEIYNSMNTSKVIYESWLKSISICKQKSEQYPLDIPIILILYSCSDQKHKVLNIIKKQVKNNFLSEDVVKLAFEQFKPMLGHYIESMLELVSCLLRNQSDNAIVQFASRWYMFIFLALEEFRPAVIAEIIQLGLSSKKYFMDGVAILKEIGEHNLNLLLPQSLQLLALLDRLDELQLTETREIMGLLCGLAYTFEDSALKDDVHMFITKQLSCSDQTVKTKGILSAIRAVKYLMVNTNAEIEAADTELTYNSYDHFSEGPTKQAAQMIETIILNLREVSNTTGYFYEELAEIISSTENINKHFLNWLADAATNDLQTNFIVDHLPEETFNDMQLSMQFGINAEDEQDGVIAINIAGLALQSNKEDKAKLTILPALFRLVQNLHYKQNEGDLSGIDALVGCPVIMPVSSLESCKDDLDPEQLSGLLDCLIICVNFFRELINAFATQNDVGLRNKVIKRVHDTEELQQTINKVMAYLKVAYKPPLCSFNLVEINSNLKKQTFKQPLKPKGKSSKTEIQNTSIPATAPTQMTAQTAIKNITAKYNPISTISLCKIDFSSISALIQDKVCANGEESEFNLGSLHFLLSDVNESLKEVLKPYFQKDSHLRKKVVIYNHKKAEETAKKVSEMIPALLSNLDIATSVIIEETNNCEESEYSPKIIESEGAAEQIFRLLTVFFNWVGFRSINSSLLKTSLRTIATKQETNAEKLIDLKDLVYYAVEHLRKFADYFKQIGTAVTLIKMLKSLFHLAENDKTLKIIRSTSGRLLSKPWYQFDGAFERGLFYNQQVDHLVTAFFTQPDLKLVKKVIAQVQEEVTTLKDKNDSLETFKSVNKWNFPVMYRHMVSAVGEAAKREVEKKLSNHEHLELWKDVAIVLKTLAEIAKALENRNNFSAYLKRSQPVLKLFITHGMPVIEIKMKNEMDLALEVLKLLQHSTRFIQNLCCHSRLKKDTALLSKVPQIRLLLETLVYKVKAALTANKCSEAFWMGNLKNKNLQGEVIVTQESVEEQEDGDDQLPPDDCPEDSDAENNADMKSTSDIADTF